MRWGEGELRMVTPTYLLKSGDDDQQLREALEEGEDPKEAEEAQGGED